MNVCFASGSKLQLEDLLAPLPMSSSLQALKNAAKTLTKGDALPAPLPQRTQDRLDREAAYEQTKAEVDKWNATMKRIKEVFFINFRSFQLQLNLRPGRPPQLSPPSSAKSASLQQPISL